MYRHAFVLAAMVGGSWMAAAADPKFAEDLAILQGNWKPLQCEYNGSPKMTTEQMKQLTAVYDKNEYFVYFVERDKAGNPDVQLFAQTAITLDPHTTPKSINFEFTSGPKKGIKRVGIYEIAGNQLKLCYGSSDLPRPTEFKSTPGSGYFLETWVRQVR